MCEGIAREDALRLHDCCARALVGLVPNFQLAIHEEQAANHLAAARLFARVAELEKAALSQEAVAGVSRRALACLRKCEATPASRRLEIRQIVFLLSTYTASPEEFPVFMERYRALLLTEAGEEVTIETQVTLCMSTYVQELKECEWFRGSAPNRTGPSVPERSLFVSFTSHSVQRSRTL